MAEEIEVPTEHLHEKMEEAAHHQRGWVALVAVSSALLAVAAAISALLAGSHANEAMLEQMKATDQWAYYQAKGIKASVLGGKLDVLEAIGKPSSPKDREKVAEYERDQKEIKNKADEYDESSKAHMRDHEQFAKAVTLFQIAIALGAISVLAHRPQLWVVSLAAGIGGMVFLVLGLM